MTMRGCCKQARTTAWAPAAPVTRVNDVRTSAGWLLACSACSFLWRAAFDLPLPGFSKAGDAAAAAATAGGECIPGR